MVKYANLGGEVRDIKGRVLVVVGSAVLTTVCAGEVLLWGCMYKIHLR